MRSCNDCGSNDWQFKTQADMTVATCRNCKNELRWASHKKKKINSMPTECKCGSKKFTRVKKPLTIKVLKEPVYFTYYFVCTKCKKELPDKTTKKYNKLI